MEFNFSVPHNAICRLYGTVLPEQPDYKQIARVCNCWRNFDDTDDTIWNNIKVIDFYARNEGGFAQLAAPGVVSCCIS